jgi:hypothetical protein
MLGNAKVILPTEDGSKDGGDRGGHAETYAGPNTLLALVSCSNPALWFPAHLFRF